MAGNFILSTSTFAAVLAGDVNLQCLPAEPRVALTPLQCNRLSLIADDGRRAELRRRCFDLGIEGTPAEKAIQEFQASRDLGACDTDPLFKALTAALTAGELDIHAHDEDVIVGQIAIQHHLCLVTRSEKLFGVLTELGGNAMMQDEFCPPNQTHWP